jgi:TonB family protein
MTKEAFRTVGMVLVFLVAGVLWTTQARADETIQTATMEDGTVLLLNGLGKAKQLTDDFYIGALYLIQPYRSVDGILNSTGPKRMQLRIANDRVSGRRFEQYWKETIAINNDKAVWQPQVKDVLKFAAIFKRHNLTTGDTIDIDFVPSQGTIVYVNGHRIGRIRNPGLYTLVLNTWIGPRPPSDSFKIGVLGGNDDETQVRLQEEFMSLLPSEKRKKAAAAWAREFQAEELAEARAKQEKEQKAVAAAEEKKARKKPADMASKKRASDSKTSVARNAKIPGSVAGSGAAVVGKVAKSAGKAVSDSGEKKSDAAKSGAKPAVRPKEEQVAVAKPTHPAISEEERRKKAREERLKIYHARNDYETVLRSKIRENMEYPIREMLRNRTYRKQLERGPMESTGVLWIRIDRKGSVISTRLEKSTGISLLDKAALAMVEKADPLPPVPDLLPGDDFEFLVQLKFVSPPIR